MIALDTSGLVALLDQGEPDHSRMQQTLSAYASRRFTTDLVLAEVDYLILKRLGVEAEQAFIAQILSGAIRREPLKNEDFENARVLIAKYADHALGLTDCTLISLAERLGALEVLTLDRKHFAMFRTRGGKAFNLLP